MNSIKFSICIPYFNSEKYIQECLGSIACQRFQNFEVIVVDDGSLEDSRQYLESLEYFTDSRFKIITANHQGAYEARRSGYRSATGDYIISLDSDDELIGDDSLDKLAEAITSAPCRIDIIYFNMTWSRKSRTPFINYSGLEFDNKGLISKSSELKLFCTSYQLNNVCSKCFRSELASSIPPVTITPFNMCEDRFMSLHIMNGASNSILIDVPMYYYRQHNASTTHRAYSISYYEQRVFVESAVELSGICIDVDNFDLAVARATWVFGDLVDARRTLNRNDRWQVYEWIGTSRFFRELVHNLGGSYISVPIGRGLPILLLNQNHLYTLDFILIIFCILIAIRHTFSSDSSDSLEER